MKSTIVRSWRPLGAPLLTFCIACIGCISALVLVGMAHAGTGA